MYCLEYPSASPGYICGPYQVQTGDLRSGAACPASHRTVYQRSPAVTLTLQSSQGGDMEDRDPKFQGTLGWLRITGLDLGVLTQSKTKPPPALQNPPACFLCRLPLLLACLKFGETTQKRNWQQISTTH